MVTLSLLLTLTAVAQDEWNSSFETTQETENASYTSANEASPQDATYVIKKGDTLWDLAFEFLGTPYQWPRIWELNRYIQNPDLIFPGDRLVIPGRGTESSYASDAYGGEGEQLLTSETEEILEETAALQDSLENSASFPDDTLIYSRMRSRTVFSEGYLTRLPFLWTEKDQTGNIYPGNAVVEPPESGASYQPFSILKIKPMKGVSYNDGDTVDIYSSLEFLRFNNKIVNLVKCVGRACITETVDGKISALLLEMFAPIVGKERVARSTRRTRKIIDTLVDPDISISAKVVMRVEKTASPYPFQKIILDKGSMQGVAMGDVFGTYYREKEKGPAHLTTIGTIGHVGSESSTLTIFFMADNKISIGDQAILLRRARFSEAEL